MKGHLSRVNLVQFETKPTKNVLQSLNAYVLRIGLELRFIVLHVSINVLVRIEQKKMVQQRKGHADLAAVKLVIAERFVKWICDFVITPCSEREIYISHTHAHSYTNNLT